MELGAFSVSLSVKNLAESLAFYEKLGFQQIGGVAEQHWLILKNGDCLLGLFQGMFENNLLAFNPGWDQSGQNTATFTDVRELQAQLKSAGLTLSSEVDDSQSGPGSFMLQDPDGNTILIDQHR